MRRQTLAALRALRWRNAPNVHALQARAGVGWTTPSRDTLRILRRDGFILWDSAGRDWSNIRLTPEGRSLLQRAEAEHFAESLNQPA